jgi:hypothetical protein
MRALSIRQPYAELILRGIKPIEFRSRPTTIIGERFYIYAAKQWAAGKLFLAGCRPAEQRSEVKGQKSANAGLTADLRPLTSWSTDLAMPGKRRGHKSEITGQGPQLLGADLCPLTSDLFRLSSDNLVQGAPPDWMLQLAEMLILKDLPTGVIVGTASIAKCVKGERSQVTGQKSDGAILTSSSLTSDRCPLTSSLYEWHLTEVERAKKLRKPKGHPQPVWFNPFG